MRLRTKFTFITTAAVTIAIANSLVSKLGETEFGDQASNVKLGLSLGNLVLALIVPIFTTGFIFRPQKQMIEAMNRIAEGDKTTPIPYTERQDEIGDMARSVQVFKDNALKIEQMAEEQKNQQTATVALQRKTREEMASKFEASVKNVVDMVASAATEMEATSKSVTHIVDQNKNKLKALSIQIEGTSRNVQTVSSTTSQLSSAITEINQQVARATAITTNAVQEASKADVTVQTLTDAAQKIGEVLEMINNIAAQINLLALNATIEAARAGDAGKGFAVVASEVKDLANQTTKATEEISQYITSIRSATGETVTAIKSIGGKIREINEISTTIASAVEEQGAATKEIATNAHQAADGTDQISRNAHDVSQSSNETGTAASEMTAATSELSKQSEILRSEVDKFLVGIRQG